MSHDDPLLSHELPPSPPSGSLSHEPPPLFSGSLSHEPLPLVCSSLSHENDGEPLLLLLNDARSLSHDDDDQLL